MQERRSRATGTETNGNARWNAQEDSYIRKRSKSMSDAELGRLLGRSESGVQLRRIHHLGILKRVDHTAWNAEDDILLRHAYGRVDPYYLAAFLNRTIGAVRARAFELGVKGRRGEWAPNEDDIIREHYPGRSVASFAGLLPERTVYAIYARATKLGLTRDSASLFSRWSQRFYAYPPELQSLIHLFNEVKRKLRDVETKH